MSTAIAVARRLKEAISSAGIAQAELARRLKGSPWRLQTSPASVHSYLQATTMPPLDFLEAAASVCGVRREWLAFGDGVMVDDSPKEVSIAGQALTEYTFAISEYQRWLDMVNSLDLPDDIRRAILPIPDHMQVAIRSMEVGYLFDDDGKPTYSPSAELREAVRLSYAAWTRMFAEGIRAHGKDRFVEKLSKSIARHLAARGIFVEARATQLLQEEAR